MCHGNEAPSTKLDIGQSVFEIAKVYSDLPQFIQDNRSLSRITKVYLNVKVYSEWHM